MKFCELLACFESSVSRGADDSRRGRDWARAFEMSIEQVRSREQVLTTSCCDVPDSPRSKRTFRSRIHRFITRNDVKNSQFPIEKVSSAHIACRKVFVRVKISVTFEMLAKRKRFNFFSLTFISTWIYTKARHSDNVFHLLKDENYYCDDRKE